MLDAVILDMDGTLLDTERVSLRAWQQAGRLYGYDIPSGFITSYFGMNREKIDRLYTETFGPDFPIRNIRAARNAEVERYFNENPIPVKPGAFELLQHIREKGLAAVLATGTELTWAEFLLAKSGLINLLDVRISGNMVPHGKPAPDVFMEALRLVDASPDRSLVVEDTENGAYAGLSAGCKVVLVPDLRQPEDAIRSLLYRCCSSLWEVIGVVDELAENPISHIP